MSIYPVRLNSWYPKDDENYGTAKTIVSIEWCKVCKKRPQYRYAIADHSLPWGYYDGIWCSKKCFDKKVKREQK